MLGVKTAALPASLRRTNQRTVISLLLRLGRASSADLAKATGLSQPTAGKITGELLKMGVLEKAGSANGEGNTRNGAPRLGRPGQLWRLDDRHPRFLAIKLDVTHTCVAALPVAVKLQDEWTCSFPTPGSPEQLVKELKRAASSIRGSGLWGVLVSVPGILDESGGKVLFCPNLHWLEQLNLPQLLQPLSDLPVLLVQEIRALALGHLTAESSGEDFFLVDFGQGVGGAIVSGGKLYSHPMPLSGEVGHSPVPGNPRRCGCGAVGCLETLVSERGLLQTFSEHGPRNTRHAHRWPDLVEHVTTHGLDPWLDEALSATANVIAGALNVLGLRRVIITGLLTDLPGCVERLAAQIKAGALWGRFGDITCEAAPHRRAAGLVAWGLDRLVLPNEEHPDPRHEPSPRRYMVT